MSDRFKRLIRLRKRLEDLSRLALAEAERDSERARETERRAQARQERAVRGFAASAPCSLLEIEDRRHEFDAATVALKGAARHAQARQVVATERGVELRVAKRDRRVIERLAADARKKQLAEQAKRERTQLDELSARVAVARRAREGEGGR